VRSVDLAPLLRLGAQARIKEVKSKHGAVPLGEVTVDMVRRRTVRCLRPWLAHCLAAGQPGERRGWQPQGLPQGPLSGSSSGSSSKAFRRVLLLELLVLSLSPRGSPALACRPSVACVASRGCSGSPRAGPRGGERLWSLGAALGALSTVQHPLVPALAGRAGLRLAAAPLDRQGGGAVKGMMATAAAAGLMYTGQGPRDPTLPETVLPDSTLHGPVLLDPAAGHQDPGPIHPRVSEAPARSRARGPASARVHVLAACHGKVSTSLSLRLLRQLDRVSWCPFAGGLSLGTARRGGSPSVQRALPSLDVACRCPPRSRRTRLRRSSRHASVPGMFCPVQCGGAACLS